MRYLFAIVCVAVLLLGVLFAALNSQSVAVDLYFVSFGAGLGILLLGCVLLGVLLGGLFAAVALGLQRRRRRRQRENQRGQQVLVPSGPVGGQPE